MTPIYSTRESYDASYRELSSHTRLVVQQAVAARLKAGEENVHLVDGLDLLGEDESDAFLEGVHPSDLGHWRTAQRLQQILQPLLA